MFHFTRPKTLIITSALILVVIGITVLCTGEKAARAKINNGMQNVTTELASDGYPNIIVQKDMPLVWDLRADSSVLNTCNSTMVISEYGIQVKLKDGDNIIEFTPNTEGTIQYTCAMGMVTGHITVVDDLGTEK